MLANDHSMSILAETVGTHALIVSDKVMDELGYLKQAVDFLTQAGIPTSTFTDVTADPDITVVANGLQAFRSCGADVLVALGGGSVIDTAKGILYTANEYAIKHGMRFKKPQFIAIPSTSGTGSEVTDFSVITAGGTKMVIVEECIAPDIAILDSTCIQHVPKRVIADTGIDVLVHGIEAFVSNKSTDFTDAMAEKSVQLIFKYLEKLYKDANDTDARDHIQNASCMAGMAFTNSNLGINHSLAHAFGGTFHLSHGRANAMLIENVIRYNAELDGSARNAACERYATLASALDLPARTPREGTVNLISKIQGLKKALDVETGIHRIERVDPELFDSSLENMAETALKDRCTATNPRVPTKEGLIEIYRKSY